MMKLFAVSFACAALLAVPAPEAKKSADVGSIYGRIQFVEAFADYDVQVVDRHEGLRVQLVERFPDAPGKWQPVDRFPDYKIRLVDSHPDFKIRYVDRFPGVN